jgi:hypothetical protein
LNVIEALKRAMKMGTIQVRRIKHRLGKKFDAAEAGGCRDILINVTFPPSHHLVELHLNPKASVDIKNGGGYGSYAAGRTL